MGLSMDNFAVTIASGCANHKEIRQRYILTVSFLFALAHFVMFSAGWLCGAGIGRFISAVDHWIAFAILIFIGGRMIQAACQAKSGPDVCQVYSFKTILLLSVATSMDALVVGIGLAFTQAPFWLTVLTLTGCVLATSYAGFYLGALLGRKFGKYMEVLGGMVLILIGVKLLLDGLQIW